MCSWCLPRVFLLVCVFVMFCWCGFVFLALLSEALGRIETTPIKNKLPNVLVHLCSRPPSLGTPFVLVKLLIFCDSVRRCSRYIKGSVRGRGQLYSKYTAYSVHQYSYVILCYVLAALQTHATCEDAQTHPGGRWWELRTSWRPLAGTLCRSDLSDCPLSRPAGVAQRDQGDRREGLSVSSLAWLGFAKCRKED